MSEDTTEPNEPSDDEMRDWWNRIYNAIEYHRVGEDAVQVIREVFRAGLLARRTGNQGRDELARHLYTTSDVQTPIVDEVTETSRPRPWEWLDEQSHDYYRKKADAVLALLGTPITDKANQ